MTNPEITPHRSLDEVNFGNAWFRLLGKLLTYGDPASPRDQATRELLGVRLHVENMQANILVHPDRGLNYRFMVAEWLWIAAGRGDLATLTRYNKRMAEFSDNGLTLHGAYGPRLAQQVDYLLNQLRTKPDTRQAVAVIWGENPEPSKDIPCTLTWQLLCREGKLHGIVIMRSSDIWLGLPHDFFNFSMLTMELAGELHLEPGSLTFNLGSSHLYDRDQAKARQVLADPEGLCTFNSPRLAGLPPAELMLNQLDTTWRFGNQWDVYLNCLRAKTSAEALDLLYKYQVANL